MRHGYVVACLSVSMGLSVAVVGLPLMVLAQAVSQGAGQPLPTFQTHASVAAVDPIQPGQMVAVAATVSSNTHSLASVDIEIYGPRGTRVFERAYDAQDFAANIPNTYQIDWAAPATAEAGAYSIQMGVFSADWSTQYTWNRSAGHLLMLSAGGVATATSTASSNTPARTAPTMTATPTPAQTPTHTSIANTPTGTPTPTATSTFTPNALPALSSISGTQTSVSGLHVVGNRIQNSAGAPVQLIGVNRSSAEYACVSNGGYGVFEGPVDLTSVLAMRAWRINTVRLVLNEDCWLGINGTNSLYSGVLYQTAIAAYVDLLTSNNIAVIVNLHFNAPGTLLATDQQPMADRDHSPTFWQSVAARFKDNSSVLFEPYNEPYPDNGSNSSEAWRCWRDGGTCAGVPFAAAGMQELVSAIRSTGARNVIILTGTNYGSQLDMWLQSKPVDPLNQLAAGWHSYGDGLDCQNEACWQSVLAGILAQVPIVATEIGEFDCQHSYIDRVMNFLDSYGQGYQAWAWGPYDCAREPGLLLDWLGTPSAYGQGFRDHLAQRP
ncbi:MAG: glycoside hydrolase family 5 protein [Chloroflexota bacterium]|nr:glycoside hydrolase family 5 protein [Chloroflexota bacterium]